MRGHYIVLFFLREIELRGPCLPGYKFVDFNYFGRQIAFNYDGIYQIVLVILKII